ncbi:hypothetical protein TWF696_005963 [Orbilia brochopaga]|uniref:Mei2-like C-terminal RNA recognition motif domain-containing protein n=1 Tax=Orbilia brochopaga TaxID=3140254 RepID=A0AAV9UX78_9PEZI
MTNRSVRFAIDLPSSAASTQPANQETVPTLNEHPEADMSAKEEAPAEDTEATTKVRKIRGFTWPPKEFIPRNFIPPPTIPEKPELEAISMAPVTRDDSPEFDEAASEETESRFPAYPFPQVASNYTLLDQIHPSAYAEQATKPAMDNAGRFREYFFEPKWGQTGIVAPSRHLKARVPKDIPVGELKKMFEEYGELNGLYASKHQSDGVLFMSFFDLRASLKCYAKLQERYGLKYCARSILENLQGHDAVYPVVQEATVRIDVMNNTGEDDDCEAQILTDVLHLVGPIISITSPVFTTNSPHYTVEFADVRDAKVAIELFRNHQVRGLHIKCQYADVERHRWVVADQMIEITESENLCRVSAGSAQLISDQRREEKLRCLAERRCSDTGHGVEECTPRHPNRFARGPTTTLRHVQLARLNARDHMRDHSPDDKSNANYVDIAAIKAGKDLRTTIMVRNIPNRLGQDTILAWLDETSFRRYDFAYLRIDFSNGCNMGYCFVNFLEISDVVNFLEARVGSPWPHYHSHKRVGVWYADMQGKPTLIARFRNSNVMDHLFHSDGPDVGLEMAFPPPNNLGQKLRSVTSAAINGLYRKGHGRGGKFNGNSRKTWHHHNRHNNGGQRGFNGGWQNQHHNGQRAITGNWQDLPSGPRGFVGDGNGNVNGPGKNEQNFPAQNLPKDNAPASNVVTEPVMPMIPPTPFHAPVSFNAPPHFISGPPPFMVPHSAFMPPTFAPPLPPFIPHPFVPAASPLPVHAMSVPVMSAQAPPPFVPPTPYNVPPTLLGQNELADLPREQVAQAISNNPSALRRLPEVVDEIVQEMYEIAPPSIRQTLISAKPANVQEPVSIRGTLRVTEDGSPIRSAPLARVSAQVLDHIYDLYPQFKLNSPQAVAQSDAARTASAARPVFPGAPTTRMGFKGKSVEPVAPTPKVREPFVDWLLSKNKEQFQGQIGGPVNTTVPRITPLKVGMNTPIKAKPLAHSQTPAWKATPKGQFRPLYTHLP